MNSIGLLHQPLFGLVSYCMGDALYVASRVPTEEHVYVILINTTVTTTTTVVPLRLLSLHWLNFHKHSITH